MEGFNFASFPDTAIQNPPDRSAAFDLTAQPNYATDWRVVTDEPGEAVMVNILQPNTTPESLRCAITDVADVFKGTKISAPEDANKRSGVSILVQNNTVYTDNLEQSWPITAHIVLRMPNAIADGGSMTTVINRLLTHLFEQYQADVENRLAALAKGAAKPKDL